MGGGSFLDKYVPSERERFFRPKTHHHKVEQASVIEEIIIEHEFTEPEQYMVFLMTFITACSFLSVMVALAKTHEDRGKDIVLTGVASTCFLIYRAMLAFRI